MGASYSYPASHLRGDDSQLVDSASPGSSTGGFSEDVMKSLRAVEELARMNEDRREFTDAVPLRERALAICDEVNPHHPITLKALQNLAVVYERQGEYRKAGELYDRVFADPTVGQSVHAIQHWEHVLNLRIESLGSKHPATLTVMSQLSASYKSIGKWDDAAHLDQKLLDAQNHRLSDTTEFE